MWDCLLRRIAATKRRNELLDICSKRLHSEPYRAGSKKTKFEKANIDIILNQKVAELTQTEWAPPILFEPNKDRTLQICVDGTRKTF